MQLSSSGRKMKSCEKMQCLLFPKVLIKKCLGAMRIKDSPVFYIAVGKCKLQPKFRRTCFDTIYFYLLSLYFGSICVVLSVLNIFCTGSTLFSNHAAHIRCYSWITSSSLPFICPYKDHVLQTKTAGLTYCVQLLSRLRATQAAHQRSAISIF